MATKLSYSNVKNLFEKENYTLLSQEYINNRTKLDYICPNGHRHSTTLFNWSVNNSRCPSCNNGVRFTEDYVRKEFLKEGYTLLSKYKNSKSKVKLRCGKKHEFYTTFNNWRFGSRCKECKELERKARRYKEVKKSFESEGYTLHSDCYVGVSDLLYFTCNNGHYSNITLHSWNKGHRCRVCSNVDKPSIEYINKCFTDDDYILLSDEYKNTKTKLDYICPNGHKHSITWSNWKLGKRCPDCSVAKRLSIEEITPFFESASEKLVSNTYINSREKLEIICKDGHTYFMCWNDWQQKHRCPICAGLKKPSLVKIKEAFEKEDYTLLSTEYINSTTKLEYICPNGHKHGIIWKHWRYGHRCPECHKLSLYGDGNPAWKGGISFEPYCAVWKDKEYKGDIRNRDENRCLNPYCDSKNPSDLTIHHIDYDKKNCKPSNLITVCRSCNLRANTDRRWHKSWYQAIISNRYYGRSNL